MPAAACVGATQCATLTLRPHPEISMAEPLETDRNYKAVAPAAPAVEPRLGVWDTVSIIVGIVVGTAIFRSSPIVFQSVSTAPWALGVWLLGGVVSWCGAVCYPEF